MVELNRQFCLNFLNKISISQKQNLVKMKNRKKDLKNIRLYDIT